MKCQDMVNRVRRALPAATEESILDETIMAELSHGVDECNLIAQVYKTWTDFTTSPNVGIYSLSDKCPTYMGITKSGVWFFDSAGKSKYLFPKTRRWLDLYIRNWRDQGSGDPNWYSIEGDELLLFYTPDAARTVRVHHLKKSTPMDNLDNYPWWNRPTELTALRFYDNAIIAYAIWMLSPALMDKENRNYYEQQFYAKVKMANSQCKRHPDMTTDYDYFIRPDIGALLPPR